MKIKYETTLTEKKCREFYPSMRLCRRNKLSKAERKKEEHPQFNRQPIFSFDFQEREFQVWQNKDQLLGSQPEEPKVDEESEYCHGQLCG